MSATLLLTLDLVLCHSVPPNLLIFGTVPSLPENLLKLSIFSTGIYSLSLP